MKNFREQVEHKIKNPIYSEILIKMNTKGVYLYRFANEFNKSRAILARQMSSLEKEGFVKKKKQDHKQIYSINWNKIVEEFWDYCKIDPINNKFFIIYFQELFCKYHENQIYPTIEDIFFNTLCVNWENIFSELEEVFENCRYKDSVFSKIFAQVLYDLKNNF